MGISWMDRIVFADFKQVEMTMKILISITMLLFFGCASHHKYYVQCQRQNAMCIGSTACLPTYECPDGSISFSEFKEIPVKAVK